MNRPGKGHVSFLNRSAITEIGFVIYRPRGEVELRVSVQV